ncbi:O-antigen ligase family protein [Pontibacillus salipaludis]|uniref:Ligase n=1 Tax=Pontibacillus salipaludis TaxID=1697394 RepID=A0ABQ1QK63_9BACI|nr:O-antigen ligase family protein [Pontibacillus salipaludis]GGD28619.1 ligase [Pontibacillus salipaludis]
MMDNSQQYSWQKHKILLLACIILGVFLNHSNVIFGLNMSFADFIILFLFFYLTYNEKLTIPLAPLIFFIAISVVVLFTSFFFTPNIFQVTTEPIRSISGYLKLLALFMFFVVGYNLSKVNMVETIIKSYSIAAVVISAIGVTFYTLNINIFSDALYYAGTRYRGLMNDPNYFSILQITALVYITRFRGLNLKFKYVATILLGLGVVVSSSKTGMIVLGLYIALRVLEYIFFEERSVKKVIYSAIFFIFATLFILSYQNIMDGTFSIIVNYIPTFSRVEALFLDFNSAISEGGSGRSEAWGTALKLIALSPLIGIGVGNYTLISSHYFGVGTLAHNTYLQFFVEFGLPLGTFFFATIFFLILKSSKKYNDSNINTIKVLRDIIIVLLLGSIAISLNNARIFWLALGALMYYLKNSNIKSTKWRHRGSETFM